MMMELLDANKICAALNPANKTLFQLEIINSIDSTNRYLLTHPHAKIGMVVLAEEQTQGCGRLGKSWVSPYGSNLYLSLFWQFFADFKLLNGLTLALGVAVVQALKNYGLNDIGLKWPNDILHKGQKLSGILVETKQNKNNLSEVVIGIGVNILMPIDASQMINQPWTDIRTIEGKKPARNRLAGMILNELAAALIKFQQHGFSAFYKEWQLLDVLYHQPVLIITGQNFINGIAQGVDDRGNLLVEIDGELQAFNSGEVSARLQN